LKRVSHPSFSLGIVVTKKIGCAVVRNKIKRRIKHAFWEMLKQQTPPAVAIVAIARKEAATIDFCQIVQKLDKHFGAG
jgi:ribonuclease P protein component